LLQMRNARNGDIVKVRMGDGWEETLARHGDFYGLVSDRADCHHCDGLYYAGSKTCSSVCGETTLPKRAIALACRNSWFLAEICVLVENVTLKMHALKIWSAWKARKRGLELIEAIPLPTHIVDSILRHERAVRDERERVWMHGYKMPPLFD